VAKGQKKMSGREPQGGLRLPVRCRVEQEAEDRVAATLRFRSRPGQFQFHYDRGVLAVTGRVPSFYLKQVLQTALHGLPDVQKIENRVDVMSVTV
jgi:hypothetical protein